MRSTPTFRFRLDQPAPHHSTPRAHVELELGMRSGSGSGAARVVKESGGWTFQVEFVLLISAFPHSNTTASLAGRESW